MRVRLGESVEVKAGASQFRRKEFRIGIGDVADSVETDSMKACLGFRSDPPEAGYGKRRKPRFGFSRQTRARIVQGNTHYPDKLLSLFEPHTEAIRKGKAVKPTEFGKVVKIQEAEAQFITDYEVCERRVPDQALWVPSLVRHEELFGRAPRLAVADAGFASRANEQAAHARGVAHVVLPRQRRQGRARAVRAALKWRTGCEGRISVLKRRHGLRRCRYRGLAGMQRWVGLGVMANNLLVLGRAGPRTR